MEEDELRRKFAAMAGQSYSALKNNCTEPGRARGVVGWSTRSGAQRSAAHRRGVSTTSPSGRRVIQARPARRSVLR